MGDCISKMITEINMVFMGCVKDQQDKDHMTKSALEKMVFSTIRDDFLINNEDDIKLQINDFIEYNIPLALSQNTQTTDHLPLQTIAMDITNSLAKNLGVVLEKAYKLQIHQVHGSSEADIKNAINEAIKQAHLSEELTLSYLAQPFGDYDDYVFKVSSSAEAKFGDDVHLLRHKIAEQIKHYNYNQNQIAASECSDAITAVEMTGLHPQTN